MKKAAGFLLGFLVWSLGVLAQTAGGVFSYGPTLNSSKIVPYITHTPDGSVVVFGGRGNGFISSATADIYSPETNTCTNINMLYPHDNSIVVRLQDGNILLAGGGYDYGVPAYAYAEIFDVNAKTFTPAGSLLYPRMQGAGATLSSGKVLIAGGWYSPDAAINAELYDPETGTSIFSGALATPRSNPVILPCNDGGAIVLGGYPTYGGTSISTVEYYNAVSNSFEAFADGIIPDETGWYTALDPFYRTTNELYQLANGNYLLSVYRVDPVFEYALVTFNPETKAFEKMETDIPLLGDFTDGGLINVALNKSDNLLYFLALDSEHGALDYSIVTVDLQDNKVYQPTSSFTVPVGEYLVYSTMAFIEETGMLLVAGVSASNADYFSGTNITYLIEPEMKSGIPIQEELIVLQVYPNPVKDMLMLIMPASFNSVAYIDILNAQGQIIYRRAGYPGEHVMIPVGNWNAGNYYIRLSNNGQQLVAPFVVGGY